MAFACEGRAAGWLRAEGIATNRATASAFAANILPVIHAIAAVLNSLAGGMATRNGPEHRHPRRLFRHLTKTPGRLHAVGRRLRLTGRAFTGCTGSGCQPAMDRAHSRAFSLLVMPGNSRRNSTTADSSPPCSYAVRIAAASASETTNIPGAWAGQVGVSKRGCCPRLPSVMVAFLWPGARDPIDERFPSPVTVR
jgi:hypothetical protein